MTEKLLDLKWWVFLFSLIAFGRMTTGDSFWGGVALSMAGLMLWDHVSDNGRPVARECARLEEAE